MLFSRRSVWVLPELVGRWTQHLTKIDQKTRKIGQICIWNPWLPNLLCKHWFASSVWNFCCWVADVRLRAKRPQGRRARRNGCFRRLWVGHNRFQSNVAKKQKYAVTSTTVWRHGGHRRIYIVCSSLGPTRGSHTARALRARRDYKLTSLGASWGIIHIKKIKLSILLHKCTNSLCSIREPWTTLI